MTADETAIPVERDVTYATVEGRDLHLDIHRAARPDAPVVVYLHGGGWASGDKGDGAGRRLARLATYGVTVVAVNYRLIPDGAFPASLHDVKGAVRWLRAHGRGRGLSTERLAVWGASAGAYLGSLLALSAGDPDLEGDVGGNLEESSEVQAVVHWFGPADLQASAARTALEERLLPFRFEFGFVGATEESDFGARAPSLNLLSRVSPNAPPFLVAHGDRDRIVPPSEGTALNDALGRVGASSRLELLAGAGHEDAMFDSHTMLAMTAAWLRSTLGSSASLL